MLALYIVLAAAAGGTAAFALVDPDAHPASCLAAGVAIGLSLDGLVGFALASLFGMTPLVLGLAATVVALVPAILWRRLSRAAKARPRRNRSLPSWPMVAYFAAFLLLFLAFFAKAGYPREGGIWTGEWNNLGDLGLHIGIIEGFVKGQNFPPEHPELAGARLTYPFLADFLAAQLVTAGAPLLEAIFWQDVLLAFVLLGLMFRWALALTRDRAAAFLAPVVVFFCGGLGFWTFVWESRQQGTPLLDLFLRPPHPVTILWGRYGDVLRWGNALTAFFLPQRAWLVGLPLALIVWTFWWEALRDSDAVARRRRLLAAGCVAGLLPLAHAHSYMVMMAMGGCLALLHHRQWREWLGFFALSLGLALPQILWITHGSGAAAGSFVAWHYGWAKPEGVPISLAAFWLVNTGLTFPLAMAALAWRGARPIVPKRLLWFLAPFGLCVVLPNFVKLSPWEWDTNKVLFYGYLALVIPLSLVLARLCRGPAWAKTSAAAALVLLTLSGAVDVWHDLAGVEEWVQFDADATAQAGLIEAHTPPRARVLSAFSASRAVLLTGRRSLVGHPWTMWSHGLQAEARLQDMRTIFSGAPEADRLLRQYRIDYVLVGPAEHTELAANDAYFSKFESVGEAGGARLYRIRQD